MPDLEVRQVRESRLAVGHDARRLTGYAIVFDALSLDLGGFREIMHPDAVNRTLTNALDVRALIDHDTSRVLGRTRAGTLRLTKDAHGLRADIDPPNTTAARDLLESVSRGDISGMSFGFKVLEDDWSLEAGQPVRTVMDMEIREVSIVSFPAYPQTEVAHRSLAAWTARTQGNRIDWLRRLHRTRLARWGN